MGMVFKAPSNVLKAGHPILRIKAEPVKPSELSTQKFKNIIEEMRIVFNSRSHPVVGLAAPQLGHSLRIIGYQVKDAQVLKDHNMDKPIETTFLINPELTVDKNLKAEYESCISIPSYSGLVKRSTSIRLRALDLNGNVVDQKYTGFIARILQHEVDHLDGINFVDRMVEKSLRHDKYIDQYELSLRK